MADARRREIARAARRASPGRRSRRTGAHNAARCADRGDISARRQCDGVPDRCVTPCAPSRSRCSATGSPALDRTSEAPPSMRAQEDLQAAIAADVVERAPDHGGVRLLRGDGAGQPSERVHDHFRHAGGAGRQHHPFGLADAAAELRPARSRRAARPDRQIERRARRSRLVLDDRIDLGAGDHGGEMAGSASGGRIVRRRATPSSSISASAVVSWLAVAINTDGRRARRAGRRRLVPSRSPRSATRGRSITWLRAPSATLSPQRSRLQCAPFS